MQVNCNQNTPSFGMSVKFSFKSAGPFLDYVGMDNELIRRAVNQYIKKQDAYNLFHSSFNPKTKAMEVIESATGKVVDTFEKSPKGETGLEYPGCKKYPFKKTLAKIFDPEKFLPYNLLLAAKRVEQLEKSAVKVERIA